MPSSADGYLRPPSSPDDTRGRRERPDKERALEVRLVREVQVLNLKSHCGGVSEKVFHSQFSRTRA